MKLLELLILYTTEHVRGREYGSTSRKQEQQQARQEQCSFLCHGSLVKVIFFSLEIEKVSKLLESSAQRTSNVKIY